ncbi:hypothetical protein Acr_02g0003710 [Actinidia rufa]|uniref:Uncharacterized protein n=1 Tax=Actinidia rufa TaxID=165716 RepID=A0A7J0E6K3_9ERIC|nr:hypothetical protein Acr_02g0003710 [Actinidia rufa]
MTRKRFYLSFQSLTIRTQYSLAYWDSRLYLGQSLRFPVPSGEEICYDSLSGFSLYISKDSDGMLIVNRVRSERVDLRKGKIVVHVMDGVIMDAEFEQSVQPDYNEVGFMSPSLHVVGAAK